MQLQQTEHGSLSRPRSRQIYADSCAVIPGGVNSPARSFAKLGLTPMIVASGMGDLILDVDGNEYIDFCCSWGSLIFGHAHPQIVQAAVQQMQFGSSFGIATEVELQIARQVVQLIPSIEKIRFVNSGTEATMTAMRLARGYTGRPKILKFTGHYHGHSDSLLIQAGSGVASLNPLATSKGVTPNTIADTLCCPFNDFAALRAFFSSPEAKLLAAVILEPVTGNMGVVPPEPLFLQMLQQETKRVGALLIFDEVITGFRLGITGAQGLYGITPDLTCLGKIIGGGFPVAAIGGRRDILDCLAPLGHVYQAGTLSGNPVAMQAGLKTLELLQQPGVYEEIERKAKRLADPIEAALRDKNGCIQRVGSMLNLFFGVKSVRKREDLAQLDEAMFAKLFNYLFDRGIYISPSAYESWFISHVHLDSHIDYAVDSILSFIRGM